MATQKQRILDYLASRPGQQFTAADVAATLGLDAKSVSSRLTKLRRSHGLQTDVTSGARGTRYSAPTA